MKVYRDVEFHVALITEVASAECMKVKHHNRKFIFRFYMYNKK